MFGHRSDPQLLWLAEGLGQAPSSLWERDSAQSPSGPRVLEDGPQLEDDPCLCQH